MSSVPKVGDVVDLREHRAGHVVRVGRGTVWADFETAHGKLRLAAPIQDFRIITPTRLQVGAFTINHGAPGQVWISRAGGEAMETHETKLAEALEAFWAREF
jgi:hypothetical protein